MGSVSLVLIGILTVCLLVVIGSIQQVRIRAHWVLLELKEVQETILKLQSFVKHVQNQAEGLNKKTAFDARLAEKFADRAMSLASGANIATIALQRAIFSGRRMPSKEQIERDRLARKKVKDILGGSEWEYLKPLLNEEELDVLEKAMEHQVKFNDAGN